MRPSKGGQVGAHGDRSKLLLRLPRDLHRALKHAAVDRDTTVTALIVTAVEGWWARQPESKTGKR
jgi:hypothetical protein